MRYSLGALMILGMTSLACGQVSCRVDVDSKKPAVFEVVCYAVTISNQTKTRQELGVHADPILVQRYIDREWVTLRSSSISVGAVANFSLEPGTSRTIEFLSRAEALVGLAGKFRVRATVYQGGVDRIDARPGANLINSPYRPKPVGSAWAMFERTPHVGNAALAFPVGGAKLLPTANERHKWDCWSRVVALACVGGSGGVAALGEDESACKEIMSGPYSAGLKTQARYALGVCHLARVRRGASKSHYLAECLTMARSGRDARKLISGGFPAKFAAMEVMALTLAGETKLARSAEELYASVFPNSSLFPCKWKSRR